MDFQIIAFCLTTTFKNITFHLINSHKVCVRSWVDLFSYVTICCHKYIIFVICNCNM
ncbi:hypothetical protein HanIR_Chr02g0084581 [Helianthus annuus]|nr:hypothetical protein HanIR_Chr02g0084581 [Helianthus annuus]